MFAFIQLFAGYQCACCDRKVSDATYLDGAFYCRECARGEHRHPGWGTKLAA
jgi:hypothetical protein